MATYTEDIPALDALASGADDKQANGIVAGEALQDDDVFAASRQHKNRKRLAELDPPLATGAEVVASKRRKHRVEGCNFSTGAPWALKIQAFQEQIMQLQQSQGQMQTTINDLAVKLETMTRTMTVDRQRLMNRDRRTNIYLLEPVIRLRDGASPADDPNVWFPQDTKELHMASTEELDSLLEFYELFNPPFVCEKRGQLENYLLGLCTL